MTFPPGVVQRAYRLPSFSNDVEPTTAYEALPAGRYLVAITASEMKPTKKGDGSYLKLEFTVLDGDGKGRKAWNRLCINHPNELTQKIARGNLSAICRAVGVMQPRDSVELHNIPLVISVKCKKREDTRAMVQQEFGIGPKQAHRVLSALTAQGMIRFVRKPHPGHYVLGGRS